MKVNFDFICGRVKLLPAETNKLGSDSNSGQWPIRRTTKYHRNWTLALIYGATSLVIHISNQLLCKLRFQGLE